MRLADALVLSIFVSICPVADISATVTQIGVKFCMMVHTGLVHDVSHFGAVAPRDPQNPKFRT